MKKLFLTFIVFIGFMIAKGQIQVVDTAQLVAIYDYECRTQNSEGQNVTDRMQLVVQVGRMATKSMPYSNYLQTEESVEAKVVSTYSFDYGLC